MRILIVEDNATSLLILRAAVERLGHECVTATNGVQAWTLLQSTLVDVIISDWMMPGLDGIELCRRARAQPRAEYVYFIFLTALGQKTEVLRGMQAGADDYLIKPLDRDELSLRLLVAARITRLHTDLAAKSRDLERLNGRLAEEGRTDALTRIGNRLRLDEDLAVIAARACRYGQRYCVAMCDIDFFKSYNDTYGHAAGDEALRMVAYTIKQNARSGDSVYRYGGEEFALILPEQTLASAKIAVEQVRQAVEALRIPHDAAPSPRVVTISAGIAALSGQPSGAVEQVLEAADRALYMAKRAGRNKVQLADWLCLSSPQALACGKN